MGRPRKRWACEVPGCPGLHHALGYCLTHYNRQSRKHTRLPVGDDFWSKVSPEPMSGCWIWTGSYAKHATHQYGKYTRVRGAGGYAHRASWILYRGAIPAGLFVCHKCDNPACVNPDHFFVGTASDNTRDAFKKGRAGMHLRNRPAPKGDEVRRLRASGMRLREIAQAVGISEGGVCRHLYGRRRSGLDRLLAGSAP